MAVLVTGGIGYIGSHTTIELIEAGREVVIVDDLSNSNIIALDRIEELTGKRPKFYELKVQDREKLEVVFKENNIEAVIHFAANSLVGESMSNPLKYFNNNVHGTEVLLRVMIKHNVNKIVFSSTAATYGEPKSIPILESDETNPTNAYGETKLAMEKMMKWVDYANENGSIIIYDAAYEA